MRCRFLVTLAAATIATPALAAEPSAPDTPKLCDGWAGKWTIVANTDRQPDGSWKVDVSDPDWHVDPTGPGKCRFYFGPGQPVGADLDVSGPDYVWTPWEKGKPQPPQPSAYTRRDITDARHWTVEIVSPPAGGAHKRYARLTMTMADDQFFISAEASDSRAGPYQLVSYTTHRRVP